MANYSNLAKKLEEAKTSLKSDYTSIKTILTSISGNYSGNSANKLNNDLSTSIQNLDNQLTYIDSLANVLNLIENHKATVKTLNDYKNSYNNWHSDDLTKSNPYASSVSSWDGKVKSIERQIRSALPTISKNSSSITKITPTIDFNYKTYIDAAAQNISQVVSGLNITINSNYQTLIDNAISDWLKGFKHNEYNLKSKTLNTFYTAEEVDNIIEERSINATRRQKAVISALTIIDLGLMNNVKSPYERSNKSLNSEHDPYTTDYIINHGADCASYVSWALNESSPDGFNNASLKTLSKQGEKVKYKNLQAGDLVLHSSHVAMVIDNESTAEKPYVVVADASSEDNSYTTGIRIQKITYDTLKDIGFTGYDLSKFYGEA